MFPALMPFSPPQKCFHTTFTSLRQPTYVVIYRLSMVSYCVVSGINAKLWRLVRAWYQSPQGMVKVGREFSAAFSLGRGVRQLGLSFINTVVSGHHGPTHQSNELADLGMSFRDIYLGASAHADDIRTLTSSKECLEKQVQMVKNFAHSSGLSLNVQKCEVLTSGSHTQQCSNSMMTNIDGQYIFASKEVKCLGYWLSWDLSAKKAIDEAIATSRRTFFMHRSQVFERNLNPLSGRSRYVLYGYNTQLTSTLVCQLESFQG